MRRFIVEVDTDGQSNEHHLSEALLEMDTFTGNVTVTAAQLWYDISTAPEDGTDILVISNLFDADPIGSQGGIIDSVYYDSRVAGFVSNTHKDDGLYEITKNDVYNWITHWTHMPPLPKIYRDNAP